LNAATAGPPGVGRDQGDQPAGARQPGPLHRRGPGVARLPAGPPGWGWTASSTRRSSGRTRRIGRAGSCSSATPSARPVTPPRSTRIT
jgi:hypothetical protein